jgi:SAM-dependent methyltransferase
VDARDWDERYAGRELVWSAGPNQFVEAQLSGLPPGRALDLACGEGRNAIWLAGRGWSVTAVDFSMVALDKARESLARHPHGRDLHVDWVHHDVLSYDVGPVGYDLVVMAYLQLRPDEMHAACRRAFGSLAVGGTFFLVGHDSTNLIEGTGGPQDPTVLYTAEDVLASLDGERFEVEQAERVARMVGDGPDPSHGDAGETTRTAYDALVRLVRTE